MPQLVAFNRKWSIGSDDFVYPGLGEICLRLIWLIVVSVIFHQNKSDIVRCEGVSLLRVYYIGLLTLLCVSIIITLIIIYTSMQGTITNIWPRRRMAKLIYIKLFIALPELAWNIMGTYWVSRSSGECDVHVAMTVKGVVISGWVIGLMALIGIAVVFDPLGTIHDSASSTGRLTVSSQNADSTISSVAQSAKRVWKRRCKILCCCVGCDEQSANAFSAAADIFSSLFHGVDLVPTDIACGLILLHREEKRQKYQLSVVSVDGTSQPADVTQIDTPCSSQPGVTRMPSQLGANLSDNHGTTLSTAKPSVSVDMICHYMKFALAIYGWPFYIFTHLMTGTCQLWSQCKCCACILATSEVHDDNCCRCNTAAIQKTACVYPYDVIYVTFHNKIFEVPFFVSIDRQKHAVVVAIRGTLSLKDVMTDLMAECDTLDIDGIENGMAHKGMLQAAKYVQSCLETNNILEQAFSKAQGAKLVITGHSLGAGTAAILAILLKEKYPDLICFAYSPPGGLLSITASHYCEDFVYSVVLGEDIIPRLGILTIDDLKARLLQAIHDCDHPKYKVLGTGCFQLLCGVKMPNEEEIEDTRMKRPLIGNRRPGQSYMRHQRDLEKAIIETQRHRELCHNTFPQMYPPGKILHIQESEPKSGCCGEGAVYDAIWTTREDFTKVIISPKMIADHFPDAVMRALDQLQAKAYVPNLKQGHHIITA